MVKIDNVSGGLTALAVFIPFYFFTIEKEFIVLFPSILLITGIVLTLLFRRKHEIEFDVEIDRSESKQIFLYTVNCLAIFGFASFISSRLFLPRVEMLSTLSLLDYQLFAILMAIAEEWFFRGALLSILQSRGKSIIAIILSSLAFTAYHAGRYGTMPENLAYVFLSGTALAYVTVKSNRLTPAMLAHVVNNYVASMTVIGGV